MTETPLRIRVMLEVLAFAKSHHGVLPSLVAVSPDFHRGLSKECRHLALSVPSVRLTDDDPPPDVPIYIAGVPVLGLADDDHIHCCVTTLYPA